MNDLSHEQAREYIQQGHQDDWAALRQHLVTCDECRAYAALHVRLLRELPARNARAHPSGEQRAAVLAAAGRGSAPPRFWRPLAMAGGFAAVLFMATALWLVLSATDPSATQPRPPGPLATFLAPFLPEPTATARPTQPAPTPTPAGTPDPRGRYVIDSVPAPSLAGNLIGEPLEQQVIVYLPPSYDTSDRRYPVVYAMISAFGGRAQADEMNQLGSETRSAMNLALRGGAQEMIVVAVDTVNVLQLPNNFLNSPVTGNWEDYIVNDLVAYIDANYRTLSSVEARGIYAEAAQGIGGLTLTARHSDVFSTLYLNRPNLVTPDMSGLVEEYFMSDLARSQVLAFLAEVRSWPAETAVSQLGNRLSDSRGLTTIIYNTVSFGINFVPNTESGAPFFDYPYTTPDGEPDPEVLRRWQNGMGDLRELLQPFTDSLKSANISILYYDEEDTGALQLSETLTSLGVAHETRASAADLRMELYQAALPFLSQLLAVE